MKFWFAWTCSSNRKRKMTNSGIVRLLNIVTPPVGLTIGGASAIPGSNLPPIVLFYGLLIAAIAKSVAGELVQIKGQSDEAQGIAPAQVASVAAIHATAAQVTPALPVTAPKTPTTPPTP